MSEKMRRLMRRNLNNNKQYVCLSILMDSVWYIIKSYWKEKVRHEFKLEKDVEYVEVNTIVIVINPSNENFNA